MENFNWTSFIIWFFVGWLVMKVAQLYLEAKNQVLAEELDQLQKRIKNRFIQVNIEKHGEIFYLFEKETGNFIAQGANMEELKAHCDARFKDKVVFANDEELKTAGLV
jgi:hypothetical protein